MPSINDFVAQVNDRKGLAVVNRYRVMFDLPSSVRSRFSDAPKTLDLLCDASGLPGRQIMTMDYQSYKQAIKIPYGFLNEDITFTFLLTGDYYAKKVFDAWAQSIINFGAYRANYLNEHTANVSIEQMIKGDKGQTEDESVYKVNLIRAFPVTIGGINLDNTGENTIQKLSVVMTYENFEVI